MTSSEHDTIADSPTGQPVDDGRMPVKPRQKDRRPKGPMSPGPIDTDDGRPKGPMSPPGPDVSDS